MSIPEEVQRGPNSGGTAQVGAVARRENLVEIEALCVEARQENVDVLLLCPGELVGELPAVTESDGVTVVVAASRQESIDLERFSSQLDDSLQDECTFVDTLSTDVTRNGGSQERPETGTTQDTHLEPRTLVAIPAYNEEETIRDVAETASAHSEEIVVIDDGSEDNTIRQAWRADVQIVAHTENRGYGSSLQTAFEVADSRGAENLVILDGDGQHDPSDVPDVVQTLEETDANVVIGSRFVGDSSGNIPLYRRFGLFVINTLSNISMGNLDRASWIQDTQSGFRAYDRDAIEHLSATETIGDDMGASLDILYQLSEADHTIAEHPIVVDYDVPSGSSQNPVTHGLGLLLTILRTTLRKFAVRIVAVLCVTVLLFAALLL